MLLYRDDVLSPEKTIHIKFNHLGYQLRRATEIQYIKNTQTEAIKNTLFDENP